MDGKRLKKAIADAGLKQRHLAERLGVDETSVSRWVIGKREPDDQTKAQLANILHVSVDYLMGRDSSTPPAMPAEAHTLTDFIPVPILSEERTACLGSGITYSELYNSADTFTAIECSMLRAYDDSNPPYAIVCHGDCLESIGLLDGFLAIVNPAEPPSNGNLGLLAINGLLSVKFISRRPNGSIAVSCDTGTDVYTPEQIEETELGILGAVVCFQPRRRPTKFF